MVPSGEVLHELCELTGWHRDHAGWVLDSVSRNIVMLISDGSMNGTEASAAKLGTWIVHPDQFEVLLNHLQPANPGPFARSRR